MPFRKKIKGEPDPSSRRDLAGARAVDAAGGAPVCTEKREAAIKPDKMIVIIVLSLLAAVTAVGVMFVGLIRSYRSNTVEESAAHLTEINRELQLYVETRIGEYWNASRSIANSICSADIDSDEELLAYLQQERDIWALSNIALYTRNGYAMCTDGSVIANDVASETITNVLRVGEYLSIRESTIIYVVPADTDAQYHGSEIVAVSVVQDLSSFLDNMGISSFDGTGCLYLTQSNGAVVSKQTRAGTESVYNLLPLLQESSIQPLSGDVGSVAEILTSRSCTVFLQEAAEGDRYIVCAPIRTGYDEMRLFYFVPVSVVNQTADSFSHYITGLSIIVILAFSIGAVMVFVYLYNARKKQFGMELSVREHMLDLLVQNSKSAFELLALDQREPRFRSSNIKRTTGEDYFGLEKTEAGYRMVSAGGENESAAVRELNEQLKAWDGESEFRSAFIRNASSAIPAYFEMQIFPLGRDERNGDYIAVAQDVTPLYERQTAAAEALVMAERSNQAKTRFLSNMSHDIRTPMNAIVNMTNFAVESIGEPEIQREYLNSLRESSVHLLQLINDVLDMSRIESGQMVVASAPFDLHAELDRIADIMRPLCAEKEQRFIVELGGLRSSAVRGDIVKLSQILINLLSNACKFTPNGGEVRLIAEDLHSLRQDVANIRFRVEDTGVGIPAADLQKVYEPFSRVESGEISKIEGTGLGLSICRSYVNAMGGTIRCESEVGKGSVFTVELFFDTAEAAAQPHAEPGFPGGETFSGRRCLVCEDNLINRTIAAKLLQRLGFSVETAGDGKEGADMFAASVPGYYDVIYMDIQMPVMDGYRATAAIRAAAHPQAASIPVIAMTANVFAEDIERARASSMNAHLGKPIIVSELIAATNTVLNRGGDNYEKNV